MTATALPPAKTKHICLVCPPNAQLVINTQGRLGLRGIRGSGEARILKCWLFPFGKWCVCGIQPSAPGLSLDQKRRRARAASVSAASTDPGRSFVPASLGLDELRCMLDSDWCRVLVRGKRGCCDHCGKAALVLHCCVDARQLVSSQEKRFHLGVGSQRRAGIAMMSGQQ